MSSVEPHISLRLSAEKEYFPLNEPIPLGLTICNEGKSVFLMGRWLSMAENAPSSVKIEVENETGEFSPYRSAVIEFYPRIVASWWVEFKPGKCITRKYKVTSDDHEFLGGAGKYLIRAKYISHGPDDADVELTTVDGKRIRRSQVWVGELISNPVRVQVVGRQKVKPK